ncbi:MAG: ADP-ribosylglycohydrolase family protein [Clostridia bacterium]|nr:ADP-ribosylglycohydrolase family protein [Clostridia bacterium]
MNADMIHNRIAGCLLGGALGDALGYPVEFDRWSDIESKFGHDGICDLVPDGGAARVSDDTQMTLFTAEGLVLGYADARRRNAVMDVADAVWQSYLCWLQTQGHHAASRWDAASRLRTVPELNRCRAPGNTCLSALLSGRMGTPDAPLNHSKGCGGVMRTAPLGFFPPGVLPGTPLGNGAAAAAITHGHPLGWLPAAVLSDLVYRCVFLPGIRLRTHVESSLTVANRAYGSIPEMKTLDDLLRRAIRLAEETVTCAEHNSEHERIASLGEGWVGEEALAVAVYAALRYEDPRLSLIAAVNHSGDSDSTGAIAGNIIGAYFGATALPADWLSKLELTDVIRDTADQCFKILQNTCIR